MPEPLEDSDLYGLSTLARRWTPAAMVITPEGRRFMEAMADIIGTSLNIVIDAEQYLPIIWSASRCLDIDIFRILEMNGIDVDNRTISAAKMRRLAMLGSDLRAWRGAFRAHRAVAGALTGGPTIMRPYLVQRAIIDETSMDMILLDASDADVTQMFVLGQGPQGTEYDAGQLTDMLDQLAKPVLDTIDVVSCYALTAWRDGIAGWSPTGTPVVISSVFSGEFEGVDMGPDADPLVGVQSLRAPTERPATTEPLETLWSTVWFKNTNTDLGGYWQHIVYANDTGDDGYAVRVYPGQVQFVRLNAGVPTIVGTFAIPHLQDLVGPYQRLDFQVHKVAGGNTMMRAYVNMDPTPWYTEAPGVIPTGTRLLISLDTSATYTAGLLRTGSITASRTEGN